MPLTILSAKTGVVTDVIIGAVLFGVGLAVRWPNVLLSPQFPSISTTILLALDVAEGRVFPLVDQAPYLGAPFVYLLAAVYKIFGPSVEATLAVPWAIGGLTVLPTYLLGREIGGRTAGLVAGGLLAASAAHTVITSHVPLSHSLTPLVATTTLWLVARASHRLEGRSLALAGFGAGLSLQTHPTVAPLLLGAALGAVLRRSSWLRGRTPYLAAALMLFGYSTLLASFIQSRFDVVADVQGKQARYLDADVDPNEDPDRSPYVNNLEQLELSLLRLTSGALLERTPGASSLPDPLDLVLPALALGGIALATARGDRMLAAAFVAGVLFPPLFSGKYKPILDGRYLMPLVPVLFVGAGKLLAEVGRWAGSRLGGRWIGASLVGLALALLVTQQLRNLESFYRVSWEAGFSNELYLRTMGQVMVGRADGDAVVLDAQLLEVKNPGGGKAINNFAWLFAVSGVPTEIWRKEDGVDRLIGRLVILRRTTADLLDDVVALQPIDDQRPGTRDRQNYRAYRVSDCASSGACRSGDRAIPPRKDDR